MNRTEALLAAFGYQGGTVWQLEELTGCEANDLIYADQNEYSMDHKKGWCSYRTCSCVFNSTQIEAWKGNLQFWLGVASGVMCSHNQGMKIEKKFSAK